MGEAAQITDTKIFIDLETNSRYVEFKKINKYNISRTWRVMNLTMLLIFI